MSQGKPRCTSTSVACFAATTRAQGNFRSCWRRARSNDQAYGGGPRHFGGENSSWDLRSGRRSPARLSSAFWAPSDVEAGGYGPDPMPHRPCQALRQPGTCNVSPSDPRAHLSRRTSAPDPEQDSRRWCRTRAQELPACTRTTFAICTKHDSSRQDGRPNVPQNVVARSRGPWTHIATRWVRGKGVSQA